MIAFDGSLPGRKAGSRQVPCVGQYLQIQSTWT